MAFDFPSSPTIGQTFAPPGGPAYVWDGVAWAANTLNDPPIDDGEYVRVNGVWRLSKQTVNLAGLAFGTLAVPAWGPSWARLAFFGIAASHYPIMRYSFDGTTFPSGAADYAHSYYYCYGGTAGVLNAGAYVTGNNIMLAPTSDHASIPHTCDGLFKLKKEGVAALTWLLRGTTYNLAANNLHTEIATRGWHNGTPSTDVKAVRIFTSGGQLWTTGRFTMEWLP